MKNITEQNLLELAALLRALRDLRYKREYKLKYTDQMKDDER